MAQVFGAFDEQLSRRVAIKLLSKELNDNAEFRACFDQEGRTVAKFRHDNIVSIYGSGQIEGKHYIVMEMLGGGSLAELLSNHSLPVEQAVEIAKSLADALQYSHLKHVVHRDLKPANVLFIDEGKPVLTDFGIAKDEILANTLSSATIIGTPDYMAPNRYV